MNFNLTTAGKVKSFALLYNTVKPVEAEIYIQMTQIFLIPTLLITINIIKCH